MVMDSCVTRLREHGWSSGSLEELAGACRSIVQDLYSDCDEHAGHGRSLVADPNLIKEEEDVAEYMCSVIMAFVCVGGAALASGLTLSVVSLDPVDLRVKKRYGTAAEQVYCDRILPLVNVIPRHRVLVTLLLFNSVCNEALPTFLSDIMGRVCAIFVAVFSVLIFGEIIPSAICTGPMQLAIASFFSPLLWCLMSLVAPVALPIAWLLDHLVPEHTDEDGREDPASKPSSKQNLMSVVAVQREMARERGLAEPFDEDEENMIRGVLSLSTLTPESAGILKTPDQIFALPLGSALDLAAVGRLSYAHAHACEHSAHAYACTRIVTRTRLPL